MKIGLYVGSFNPITTTHVQIIKDLLNINMLDYTYFLPVNSSKNNLISIQDRIKLLKIGISKLDKTEVLNIYNYEITGLFNYQVLKRINLRVTHLIIGSDLFLKFKNFSNYEKILNEFFLIIIQRNNFLLKEYVINNYQKYLNKIIIIEKEYPGSSTFARVNNQYLDKEVLAYIKENNLYT